MPHGIKSSFPLYARRIDGATVTVLGECKLTRITPKTWKKFLQTNHGKDINIDEYVLANFWKVV